MPSPDHALTRPGPVEYDSSFDFGGCHALVIGAAPGPGQAVALALAGAGATVLPVHSGSADGDSAAAIATRCRTELGAIDIAVVVAPVVAAPVVAAPQPPRRDAAPAPAEFADALNTILTWPVLAIGAVAPLLRRGAGVVLVGPGAPRHPGGAAGAGVVAAGAGVVAAGGLAGLARSLSAQLGPRGVRVNHVAVADAVHADPQRVAAVVLFLAGPLANGVNGATVVVDGGE
jgi:NAD(P)-dependent dehydrogenase (short-subunit alcohol dehydrogenase family)